MRIWIRPRMCGGCRAQNLEILQLRGLQDLGTDWLWRRLLPGVCLSWLVWLYCPLTKHEYKEKEKIWRDQDSLVIYLEFLVTRGDIWEPVYIWLRGTSDPHLSLQQPRVPFSQCFYALSPNWLRHKIQWVLAFWSARAHVSATCQAPWASLHPSLNPFVHFKSTQSLGLGFNIIFLRKTSRPPSSSVRLDLHLYSWLPVFLHSKCQDYH